jgi:uridylate kinase
VKYKRILLKLSGEALKHNKEESFKTVDHELLLNIVDDIVTAVRESVEVGIVLGGGNWFRGTKSSVMGVQRVTADHVGMLATVMNALILKDLLNRKQLDVSILSAVSIPQMVETFEVSKAKEHLNHKKVVIFAGGTGNPFVSTDYAASLRALEIEADILLKATTVDGVYSADPRQYQDANYYQYLSYEQVIREELAVMDLIAFIQCRNYKLPIRVFNLHTPHSLIAVMQGKDIGTLIS